MVVNLHISIAVVLLICCVDDIVCWSSGYYIDNGVDQTEKLHEINPRSKRELQQEILTLLGLHHRPKPKVHTNDYSAPRFMLDLYNTIAGADGILLDDTPSFRISGNISIGDIIEPIQGADVIMSFVNRAKKVPHLRHEKDRTFFFDFSEVTVEEKVVKAELRIFKDKAKKWKSNDFQIQIYLIKQGPDPEDKYLESVGNVTTKADHVGWLTLDLTKAAELWTQYPTANLGLYMKIKFIRKGSEVDPDKFGIVGHRGAKNRQPFLTGFFKASQKVNLRKTRAAERYKRQAMQDMSADQPETPAYRYARYPRRIRRWPCQRKQMFVKFKDLGWQSWIIAPDGFQAFYCEGECQFPLAAHMNATNHAIVQTLVHLMNPKQAPSPGCAPTKLGAQSVLYFDDNLNVVLQKFPMMIVKSCGCH
ncbi:bone morphogenetic protein 7-like [Mytilus californianus]|uniref:bone morphogenetic protein 7-like n=1 Tax=Mytilus californianus TaxID=6549 RepID=UPI00224743BA|nr:bone morphogenetic protein 7-like [Mytilus californianus]